MNAAGESYSQEFEAEPDFVALYMLTNSGDSVSDAPRFWLRMAMGNPGSVKYSHEASHPSTPYRMVALEDAAEEIDAKRASGALLVPCSKGRHALRSWPVPAARRRTGSAGPDAKFEAREYESERSHGAPHSA